jgi:SAM-dependent methyltransferase
LRCPLCGWPDLTSSGFGSVTFEGRTYEYRACRRCDSAACDPMPDVETLGRMYGPAYADSGAPDTSLEDPKAPEEILARLRALPPGRFVDFGCGAGSLLESARTLGWTAIGVEFDPDVARRASALSHCPVVTRVDELRASAVVPADVLHLGDVLEHLTAPLDVLRPLVKLLGPTGRLFAQGPLEAGPCLFATVVRTARRLRRARPVEMPPYHVLQATVAGQRTLFERAGLDTLEYRVSEVAWPAPAKLTGAVLHQPRNVGLFLLRKASQAASALAPTCWGNRYFYVGAPRGQSS